jgi:hypothetical protein
MIIALGYRKQTGKDTVAAYLKHRYRFRRIALAARVKRAAQVAFDLTEDDCETEEGKSSIHPKLGVPNRYILQKLADAAKSAFGDEVWLKMLELESLDPSYDYVISDMRFRYEFNAIKRVGGICIRIDRETSSRELHVSEHNLTALGDKPWDFIVTNNGTVDDLYEKIDTIMERFGK